MKVIPVRLIPTTIDPSGIAMKGATAGSYLLEVAGFVDRSLMVFRIGPCHNSQDIGQVWIFRVPVVSQAPEGLANGTSRDREGMFLPVAVDHFDPLNRRINPESGKFKQIHRTETMICRRHSGVSKQHHTAALPINSNPIRKLGHRAPAVEIVFFNNHRRRFFQIGHDKLNPLTQSPRLSGFQI